MRVMIITEQYYELFTNFCLWVRWSYFVKMKSCSVICFLPLNFGYFLLLLLCYILCKYMVCKILDNFTVKFNVESTLMCRIVFAL